MGEVNMMTTTLDALSIRRKLGTDVWDPPVQFGPDGWVFRHRDRAASIIVTAADHDGDEWVHASFARADVMPSYADLLLLHEAVFARRWAYQVFVPRRSHVNIHDLCLHMWGRADGSPALPDFGINGTI